MPTLDKTPVEHTPDSADTQSTAPVPEAVTEEAQTLHLQILCATAMQIR